MKSSFKAMVLLWVLSVAQSGAAETYSTGFEAPPFNDPLDEVAGTDGWTIDNGVPNVSFVISSWDPDDGGPAPASQAAGLGGFFDSPGGTGTEVNLTRPVSIDLTAIEFDVDFAVLRPSLFPGEDSVGFSFKSPSSDLLRIAFEPSDGFGDLEIVWYNEVGVRTSILQDILYDATYKLSIDFDESGPDATFDATMIGTNTVNFSGTLSGQSGATVTSFGIDFDVIGDGDSFIAVDNLSVVPEPHSAMLIALALAGTLRRRR